MTQFTCKHPDGCDRPSRKLGWCSLHYNRLYTTGDVGPAGRVNHVNRGSTCQHPDGCPDPAVVKGWCMFHYDRVRHTGEPGSTDPKRRRLPKEVRTWTPGQRHRFYKYGLTPEAFDAKLVQQGGRCYICRTDEPGGKGWSVDHCHKSGEVRFITCNPCNAALGLVREDPQIAKRLYEVTLELAT